MSTIESPSQPTVQVEVDPTFNAGRMTLRPHDFKGPNGAHIGGHYRTPVTTGATTILAAGAAMFSLRWANPDRALIINRVEVFATVGTAFGAAQEVSADLVRTYNMINPDTGGTAIIVGDSCRKSRSNMQPSVVADMRVCAAVALGAGAGTSEEVPSGATNLPGMLNVAGSMGKGVLYDIAVGHEGPIVILRNEGFRIRNRTLMGAAGVVVWTFTIDWSEVPTSLLGA